ncbi:hypothetical protein [Campylobacter concisus]|uniref:hypothetical protein n=1 Tax=Campylobacter concisus TaxID=199 RepID=UPI000CD895FE|nr:hypothetical protein [Campylobacter concisus]
MVAIASTLTLSLSTILFDIFSKKVSLKNTKEVRKALALKGYTFSFACPWQDAIILVTLRRL